MLITETTPLKRKISMVYLEQAELIIYAVLHAGKQP